MVLNMVGGGGGSLKNTDAILIVTTSVGATVTATKGGITLTPTIWETSGNDTLDCALFYIKASTFDENDWTITATQGGYTHMGYVVINSAKEYTMNLEVRKWIYKDGTNNGLVQGNYSTYTQKTVSFDSQSIKLAYPQSSGNYCCSVISSSKIDMTSYSQLHIVIDVVSRPTTNAYNNLALASASPTYTDYNFRTSLSNGDLLTGENEYTLSLYSANTSYYVLWDSKTTGSVNSPFEAYIKSMWME